MNELVPGTQLEIESLYEVLRTSRRRGFLGPGDPEAHIHHSMGFARSIGSGASVVDLGSGGGVPGLPLLVRRPDLRVTLLDSARRRIDFLTWALRVLSEANPAIEDRSDVLWGRAEEMAGEDRIRGMFDVVVARSFGRPPVVAECARPFLRSGGLLVVSEPPIHDDQRWPLSPLEDLGLSPLDFYRSEGGGFAVLEAVGDCPDGLPRRPGVAERRPAF